MKKIEELIINYPKLNSVKEKIAGAYNMMQQCYEAKRKMLLCGNGGSSADCEHIVGELLKEYKVKRKLPKDFAQKLRMHGADENMLDNIVGTLPAISLTSHISFITAFCNDNDAEYVFAQQLYALGQEGDLLVAITTSGNSKNVINAAIMAKAMGIKVIALTGGSGGEIKKYADVLINVPGENTAQIQELHLPVYHILCEMLEEHFFIKTSEE